MLNHKQQLFMLEYQKCLNATKAAKAAGYSPKTAGSIANELLKKPEIQQALQHGLQERSNSLIAGVSRIQEFWTQTMDDSDADLKHRLRASELLAKSLGMFIEQSKVEVHEVQTLADLMLDAYHDNL